MLSIIFSVCSKPLKRPSSGKLMRMEESERRHVAWGGKRPRTYFSPQRCSSPETASEFEEEFAEERKTAAGEDGGEEEEEPAAAGEGEEELVAADEGEAEAETPAAAAAEEEQAAPAAEENGGGQDAEEAAKEPVSHFRSLPLSRV